MLTLRYEHKLFDIFEISQSRTIKMKIQITFIIRGQKLIIGAESSKVSCRNNKDLSETQKSQRSSQFCNTVYC